MMPLCVCVLAVSLWSGGPGVQVLMSTDLSNCCPPEEGLRVCGGGGLGREERH